MTAWIDCITFDTLDHRRLAQFWAAVLGYQVRQDEGDLQRRMRDHPHGARSPTIAAGRIHSAAIRGADSWLPGSPVSGPSHRGC
jgi:hypothetical protein